MNEQQSTRGYTYTGFSTAEAAFGLFWLSLGALISLALEVIYLTTWLPLPWGGAIVFPISILIAAGFNKVLSTTALLWSRRFLVAAIPLLTWIVGFIAFAMNDILKGDILVGSDLRGILLLVAGIIGGGWPLTRKQ